MLPDFEQSDRRKYKRFDVKDLAIAFTKTKNSRNGRIVNVSKGGMAVRYFEHDEWLVDTEYISILYERKFFISDIPIQKIHDLRVENQVPSSNFKARQCCFKFGPLSNKQYKLLEEFIEKQHSTILNK